MKIENTDILEGISEKFTAVDIKPLDVKKRIHLGEKIHTIISRKTKLDGFKIFIGDEGDILLRPVVTIPSREAWIYKDPEVLRQIRQGLSEAKQGKIEKVKDLNKFLKNL